MRQLARPFRISLWSARHNFFGEGNSLWLLDMGTSWYFSWKLNYFGIPKWKQGLFNIPQSGHESVYLLEPSFHSRTPNNSTFMKNISWCPCLKVRVNFLPQRNYAAHFTVASSDVTACCPPVPPQPGHEHGRQDIFAVGCVLNSVIVRYRHFILVFQSQRGIQIQN